MIHHLLPPGRRGGFSLIEVMVAMGLLVIGMSGIFALFSAALALQKEATENIDVGLHLLGIQAEIERDLAERLWGEDGSGKGGKNGDLSALDGAEFEVPGDPRYRYRITVQPIPDDPRQRGFLCHVVVLARRRGQDSEHDLGYLPVIPRRDNDALIREALGQD